MNPLLFFHILTTNGWETSPLLIGIPFHDDYKFSSRNAFMLDGVNAFLDTTFTEEDMEFIYHVLGNAVRHDLTEQFIAHDMDIAWLKSREAQKCG